MFLPELREGLTNKEQVVFREKKSDQCEDFRKNRIVRLPHPFTAVKKKKSPDETIVSTLRKLDALEGTALSGNLCATDGASRQRNYPTIASFILQSFSLRTYSRP